MTRRLAWFVAIWLAGVLSLGVVAYGLRGLIFAFADPPPL